MRNRIAIVVSAMLVVGLVAGLATSASGAGDPGAAAAKKKKKVCPAGTHKVTVKKKNGKKKKKCVADTPTTPTGTAALKVSPTSFTYPAKTQNRVTRTSTRLIRIALRRSSPSQTLAGPRAGFSRLRSLS